jgi:hypothetical protein
MSDELFLTHTILCKSLVDFQEYVTAAIMKNRQPLMMYYTKGRLPTDWPTLPHGYFGIAGGQTVDRNSMHGERTRRLFFLIIVPIGNPKIQEMLVVEFLEENTGCHDDEELQFPFFVRVVTRVSRMTPRKSCLDSRSSDECMMLCALDPVEWSFVELEYQIRRGRGTLLEMTVHGYKGEPRLAYDPTTNRRIPKPAKDVPDVKKPKLFAKDSKTGEARTVTDTRPPTAPPKSTSSRAVQLEKRLQRIQKAINIPKEQMLAICDWGGTSNTDNLVNEHGDLMQDKDVVSQLQQESQCNPEDVNGDPVSPEVALGVEITDGCQDWYVSKVVDTFIDEPIIEVSPNGGICQYGGASGSSGTGAQPSTVLSSTAGGSKFGSTDRGATAVKSRGGDGKRLKSNANATTTTANSERPQSKLLAMSPTQPTPPTSAQSKVHSAPPLAGVAQ